VSTDLSFIAIIVDPRHHGPSFFSTQFCFPLLSMLFLQSSSSSSSSLTMAPLNRCSGAPHNTNYD